jgi:hypothetical protein
LAEGHELGFVPPPHDASQVERGERCHHRRHACLALMLVPAHRDVLLRPPTESSQALRIGELWALRALAYAALVAANLGRDRKAVLATLVKGLFGPLMALSLIALCAGIRGNVQAMWPS